MVSHVASYQVNAKLLIFFVGLKKDSTAILTTTTVGGGLDSRLINRSSELNKADTIDTESCGRIYLALDLSKSSYLQDNPLSLISILKKLPWE